MNKKWKTVSSEQVFSHPRHNVFIDKVMLPNGQETEYIHFGKLTDAAMVIARNSEGKILIQKEYSYPVDEILYQFPGGLLLDSTLLKRARFENLKKKRD
jgi:ADP-ribose pyrophosphatase